MTQSPTSQPAHCPLSYPLRPLCPPPSPSPPCQSPLPALSCSCPPSSSCSAFHHHHHQHCHHHQLHQRQQQQQHQRQQQQQQQRQKHIHNRHRHLRDYPRCQAPLLSLRSAPCDNPFRLGVGKQDAKDPAFSAGLPPHPSPQHLAAAVPGVTAAACVAAVVVQTAVCLCRTLLVVCTLLLTALHPATRRGRRKSGIQVSRTLLTLCVLSMMTSRTVASPWVEESFHSVKLRAEVCQPVPEEHLRNMLGAAYDPSRMSTDNPSKRSHPGLQPEMEEAVFDSYMEDDPRAGHYVDEDMVDIVTDGGKEEGWFRREEEEVEAGRIEVEEEEAGQFEEDIYRNKDIGSLLSSRSRRPDPRSHHGGRPDVSSSDRRPYYMRRRRRGAGKESRDSAPGSGGGRDSGSRDKKSKDSLLPLRLLLSGRNRKLRRKLKKEFRKKAKKLGRKPPPWTCTMTKVWGQLKAGFFPRYVLDGRCQTDKCFYRLYKCAPQEYKIKLLKRDPDYCNPLPTVGVNSTYEQKWTVVRYNVIVGCNCQAFGSSSQNSSSGRRRYS